MDAAKKKGLDYEEMDSKVNDIVAHGISSYIEEKKVIIGSYHFVFDDEKCQVRPAYREKFDGLPEEHSHSISGWRFRSWQRLSGIEDPLREEAADIVRELREAGIENVGMMTGDSERTAAAVSHEKSGLRNITAKYCRKRRLDFIEKEKAAGRKVIMIGDGIDDSPALSAANVGIAISDGAEIAREVADITIMASDLA